MGYYCLKTKHSDALQLMTTDTNVTLKGYDLPYIFKKTDGGNWTHLTGCLLKLSDQKNHQLPFRNHL